MENFKDQIFYELINPKLNEERLKNCPHRMLFDMAVVYRIMISRDGEFRHTIFITNEWAALLKMSEEELYQSAKKNTPSIYPVKQIPLSGFMICPDADVDLPKHINITVTNDAMGYGAITVFYDGVLEKIAEEFDDDVILMPSSVHEFIVMPSSIMSLEAAKEMVADMNKNRIVVAEEDVLADAAYIYRRETGEIQE